MQAGARPGLTSPAALAEPCRLARRWEACPAGAGRIAVSERAGRAERPPGGASLFPRSGRRGACGHRGRGRLALPARRLAAVQPGRPGERALRLAVRRPGRLHRRRGGRRAPGDGTARGGGRRRDGADLGTPALGQHRRPARQRAGPPAQRGLRRPGGAAAAEGPAAHPRPGAAPGTLDLGRAERPPGADPGPDPAEPRGAGRGRRARSAGSPAGAGLLDGDLRFRPRRPRQRLVPPGRGRATARALSGHAAARRDDGRLDPALPAAVRPGRPAGRRDRRAAGHAAETGGGGSGTQ